MLGTHVLKSYSKQQRTVALSSAEAELHALVAASSETLGILGLLKDMGCVLEGEIYSDSSAALGIAQRQGIGKLRHVRTQALWVQEVKNEGRIGYKKVLGSRNPADALTKYVPGVLMDKHLEAIGVEIRSGRAESAPTLDNVEPYTIQKIEKIVKFSGKIELWNVPSVGLGKPVRRAVKTRWKQKDGEERPAGQLHQAEGEARRQLAGGDQKKGK